MPAGGPRDPDTSQAKAALKDADIIVIPAGIPRTCCNHRFREKKSREADRR